MSQFTINTRNELKKKQDSLSMAKRGHSMLKQKLNELTKAYFELSRKTYLEREKCRDNLLSTLDDFALASAHQFSPEVLREFLLSADIFSMSFGESKLCGKTIPSIKVDSQNILDYPYAFASTNILFDDILGDMKKIFLSLVHLSSMEKSCDILSSEIESLKVRVNYLELSLIPKLESEIAYIDMKIEENNTYNTIRLLKAKELSKK